MPRTNFCGKQDAAKAIIRDWIHDAGIGYAELAKRLNISSRTLSRRLKYPEEFSLGELRSIKSITAMSDDDFARLGRWN